MVDVTKILYDASQAIKEFKKLSRAADQSADAQGKSLDEVEGKLDNLEQGLGKLNPRLGEGVKRLRGIGAVAGPASIALSAVGVAVAGIAANFVDLPNFLRDASEEIDTFTKNSQQLLRLRDSISSIGDALEQQRIAEGLRKLNLQQAATVDRQVELQNERQVNQDKLQLASERLRKLESLVKASARRRAEIERRAADTETAVAIDEQTRGATAGGAVVNLAAAAEEAALEGNIEKAKALVDEAKRRSEELGNHQFFTTKIAAAEETIAQRNQASAKAEADRTQALQAQLTAQRQRVESLKAEEAQIKRNLNLVRDAQFSIRSERRNLTEQRATQVGREQIGDASRRLDIGIEVLQKQIGTARGPVQAFTDTVKALGQAFARGGPEFESEVKAINALEERTINAVSAIAERTPEAIQRGIKGLETIQADLRRLEDAGPLDSALQFNVENIRKAIQTAIDEIVPATELGIRGGVQRDQRITEDASQAIEARLREERRAAGIVKDSLESAADSSERIKNNLRILEGTPANTATPARPEVNAGAAAVTPARVEVTSNVDVRGGLIDTELQEQIGDIAAQRLRKELSSLGLV